MAYKSLEECLLDLEKTNQLIRVKEEVDPYLEMAAIHLRVHEAGGPALLFENVKGSKYRAASNIFGTLERSEFIFKTNLPLVQKLIEAKNNPLKILKKPFQNIKTALAGITAFPKKINVKNLRNFEEIKIEDIPQIQHWLKDGGAFVTLPQVYTEDADKPGIMHANLGMYRIQLSGNDYKKNEEIGLHYQLHRGIGVHQTKANKKGTTLKVSIFVGGPPAHSVAAVMPLPEGVSEMTFAGALAGHRFRYTYKDGYCISMDADFVITGEVMNNNTKPEGPFGDHLGYYSLQHLFPVLKVYKVFVKKNAIWPFTVVGRPPQEDTSFGELIHHIAGNALPAEIPGLIELNAVDAAGVHPLLLAIGSERYTPYAPTKQPAELLTIANHILGTGQLSLAKFLFITADEKNELRTKNITTYFDFILRRIDLQRDIHFYTNTTIDTLDYSGTNLNSGSKVVIAAYGMEIRELMEEIPSIFYEINFIAKIKFIMKGVVAIQFSSFSNYENAAIEMNLLHEALINYCTINNNLPFIIVCDDVNFVSENLNNFLWTTFTKCNPSHDMYGINTTIKNKHWGCNTLIFDARNKPLHAPALIKDEATENAINRIFEKGGSLYGVFNKK